MISFFFLFRICAKLQLVSRASGDDALHDPVLSKVFLPSCKEGITLKQSNRKQNHMTTPAQIQVHFPMVLSHTINNILQVARPLK